MNHQSVLLTEAMSALAIQKDGIYIDGTFGRGGHSRAILEQLSSQGRVIAIDKDLTAIAHAQQAFSNEPRLQVVHGSFANMLQIARDLNVLHNINGILLDLGVSSPQLDDASRGFSFMASGPLDMRMDVTQDFNAATFVNEADEKELIQVFREYGEERFAKRIAQAIIHERQTQPFLTTDHLAAVVKAANPKWEKYKHPATRVFQAIRIHVNRELEDLKNALKDALEVLAVGGRLAVISFHSLEDRIVKQFMRDEERGIQLPRGIPVKAVDLTTHFRRVGKAIMPSEGEIKSNLRARSAVLRVGEKIK